MVQLWAVGLERGPGPFLCQGSSSGTESRGLSGTVSRCEEVGLSYRVPMDGGATPGASGGCGSAEASPEARRDGALAWRGNLRCSCLGPGATSRERPRSRAAGLGCANLRARPPTHPLLCCGALSPCPVALPCFVLTDPCFCCRHPFSACVPRRPSGVLAPLCQPAGQSPCPVGKPRRLASPGSCRAHGI